MRIEGATVVATGGGSGLGRATAEALHAAGANVLVLDLPSSEGAAVADALGDRAAFVPADVTSTEQVQSAIDLAVERFGALHVAVNCAGIAWAGRTVGRDGVPHDLDVFASVLRVNVVGTFNVIRLAAARMTAQDPVDDERGVIVNTASIAAFDGQVGQAAYAASKGAVASLTLPVARDLSRSLIRCVAIAPGTFETPMLAQLPQPAREQLERDTPHPARLGRPSEYASLVLHVVENPMVNGEVIRLDGALRMPFVR